MRLREGSFRLLALLLFVCLIYYGYALTQTGELALNDPGNGAPPDTAEETEGNVTGDGQTAGAAGADVETIIDDVVGGSNPAVTILKDEGTDFFIDYKLERERTRSYQQELLQGLVTNPSLDDASRRQAAQQLLSVSDKMGQELEVENLIKAKGFSDALVLLHQDAVVVIVKANTLGDMDVAKIVDIVTKSTGVKMDRVIVLPKA